MVEMYKAGLSILKIAKKTGVNPETVRRALIRAGVSRRSYRPVVSEGVTKTIVDMYNRGVGSQEIATHLDACAILGPRGGAWSPKIILRVLRNKGVAIRKPAERSAC